MVTETLTAYKNDKTSDVFRPFGGPVYRPKLWRPKNTFQVFFLYVNKNFVEVEINDFIMHLTISKWLRKMQIEVKNNETKRLNRKKRVTTKMFLFI